jgi:UDP-N-acetylglucosamine 2-epimerase
MGKGRVFINLDPVLYWSLLRSVDLLVGNSSSGIMEAASFALPAVDVGIRQRGRERGRNVLDAEATAASILDRIGTAMDADFRRSLQGMENPYGDGHAAERIAAVLTKVLTSGPLGEELLIKRAK